jgi:group I intron endonuclease
MQKCGVIYIITNIITNKQYIGQTTQSNPEKRINKHFKGKGGTTYLDRAITKYGEVNFKYEIIFTCFSQEDLNYAEKTLISKYNTVVPNGYNVKLGGAQGGKLIEETKQKISKKTKEWYRKNKHPFKGKKFTKKHRENLSKVRKGFTSKARRKVQKEIRKKHQISIVAIHIDSNTKHTFDSIEDCAKSLNLCRGNISKVLNNKENRTQHKGYKFYRKNRLTKKSK